MNQALVLGLIGIVVAGFVLWPLLRRRVLVGRSADSKTLVTTRPSVAAAEELAELELDHAMGRVSEADFTRWRGEIDDGVVANAEAPLPDERATLVDANARAEALVRKWRYAPRPSCPKCGERPEAEARYCSKCGASLTT